MQIKVFNIPIYDKGEFTDALNRFLSTVKVVKIDQHFYANKGEAVWCFCVSYLHSQQQNNTGSKSGKTAKIDYKQVLSSNEFEVFTLLREIRKDLAKADAVPAYAVFTDAELAQIATTELNKNAMLGIKGISVKRFDKYGEFLLEAYHKKKEQ